MFSAVVWQRVSTLGRMSAIARDVPAVRLGEQALQVDDDVFGVGRERAQASVLHGDGMGGGPVQGDAVALAHQGAVAVGLEQFQPGAVWGLQQVG